MKGTSFVGGEHFTRQLAQFRFANDFAVATPGRLLDLVARGVVNINHVSYLVLDEADRMIDMGFAPQIRAIFEHIRPDRICTMWSATWPRQVSEIAVDYISDPVMIKIGKSNLTANKDIKQTVMLLDERAKSEALVEILKKRTDEKGIIFCNTTANCDYLSELMQDRGINNIAMHGRRTRDNRIKAFDTFKNGNAKIMIATDVASRGLDIKDVNFIVVYDFPEDIEDYVHRIGRTGRAGKRGEAYAFFTKRNISNAKALKELLETSGNEVPDNLISLSKMV